MAFRGLLRPGQGCKTFTVLRRKSGTTATGRPKTTRLEPDGEILGIISQASQREVEQSKQNGHPISHTVIQRGTENKAKPTDVLELDNNGEPRRFLIQTVRNPGEIDHFIVYKVEERVDLQ